MERREANGFVPLQFPASRTALWDYRGIGPSVQLLAFHNRNVVASISETPLRLLQKLAKESADPTFSCVLLGSLNLSEDGESIFVQVDRLDQTFASVEDYSLGPSDVALACSMTKNCACPESTVDEYLKALQNLKFSCTECSQVMGLDFARFTQLLCHCSFHDNQTSIIIHLDCDLLTPTTEFKATPVNPIPIVQTNLSKSLLRPNVAQCYPGQAKLGFLTMDQTRKLLLVLASDPKVCTLPVVGVWVSGVCELSDPVVWCACLKYVSSTDLRERVCLPPERFLLVVFSTRHSKPLFYQCCTSDGSCQLKFDLCSAHEVLQLPKTGMCRSSSPLEMDLSVVGSGPKRETFEAALMNIREEQNVIEENVSRRSSGEAPVMHDDITPRSKPMPHTKSPCATYSVPDVTLYGDDDSFCQPNTRRQSEPRAQRTSWPTSQQAPKPSRRSHPMHKPPSGRIQQQYPQCPPMDYAPVQRPHAHPEYQMEPPRHPAMPVSPSDVYHPIPPVAPHHQLPQHPQGPSQPQISQSTIPYGSQPMHHQVSPVAPHHQHPTHRSQPQGPAHHPIQISQSTNLHASQPLHPQHQVSPITPHPQHTTHRSQPPQVAHPPIRPQISASSPKAHTSSNSHSSPKQTSTDSGLQVGNSDQFDDSAESRVPPYVYEILNQQKEDLKDLREQLAQLQVNQKPDRKETGVQTDEIHTKQTRSIATNTIARRNSVSPQKPRPEFSPFNHHQQSPARSDESLNNTVTSKGHDLSNECLDDLDMATIQETQESFVSDMILDMPVYSSTSPLRNEASFGSGTPSSALSPESISMHAQEGLHCEEEPPSPERDKWNDVFMANAQKFRDYFGDNVNHSVHSEPVTHVTEPVQPKESSSLHLQDKYIDIAQTTRNGLQHLGIDLTSADPSLHPDQSLFLLDTAMLPKVDYQTLYHDSGDSELSIHANAVAMKYLSVEQISELSSVKSKKSKERPMRRDMTMLPDNQLSMCSRNFLERYGLTDDAKSDHTSDMNVEQMLERLTEKRMMKNGSVESDDSRSFSSGNGLDHLLNSRPPTSTRERNRTRQEQSTIDSALPMSELERIRSLPKLT